MRPRRPIPLRTVGSLALAGLLVVNGWLLLLNLAKHDRLPAVLEDLPGLAEAGRSDDSPDTDDVVIGADGPEPFSTDGTAAPGTTEVDLWPGGRGPEPDGAPTARRVVLSAEGNLRVVGSAPAWSVVTDLVDELGRRLGVDASSIGVDVSWHPEASPRPADAEVLLERPLRYQAGQIELPGDGSEVLAPVVALLNGHPELFVVVVGLLDDDPAGGDEEAAILVGRTALVVEELVAGGIAADRVVTSVASPPAASSDQSGGVVELRIENLLVFGPSG